MDNFLQNRLLRISLYLSLFAILLGLSSCINECDTNNGYLLGLELDSAGKPYSIKYALISQAKDTLYKSKSAKVILPLDISTPQTSFYIATYKTDASKDPSRTDLISVRYKTKAYNKGADCGMDIKIMNFSIDTTSFLNPNIVSQQITSDTTLNVKIDLHF